MTTTHYLPDHKLILINPMSSGGESILRCFDHEEPASDNLNHNGSITFMVMRNPFERAVERHLKWNQSFFNPMGRHLGMESIYHPHFYEAIFDWQIMAGDPTMMDNQIDYANNPVVVEKWDGERDGQNTVILNASRIVDDWEMFKLKAGIVAGLAVSSPASLDYTKCYTPERVMGAQRTFDRDIKFMNVSYPRLMGDFLANITSKLGFKRCGDANSGCEGRRRMMNEAQRKITGT